MNLKQHIQEHHGGNVCVFARHLSKVNGKTVHRQVVDGWLKKGGWDVINGELRPPAKLSV